MSKVLEEIKGRNAGSQVGPGMAQGTGCLTSSSALSLANIHLTSFWLFITLFIYLSLSVSHQGGPVGPALLHLRVKAKVKAAHSWLQIL